MTKNFAPNKMSILTSTSVIKNLCNLLFEGKIYLEVTTNKRNGIDPAKISGPYSLLVVMLLVAEILFAIWFYKAQSPMERTIAGSIVAVVFISLMILVLRMNRTR